MPCPHTGLLMYRASSSVTSVDLEDIRSALQRPLPGLSGQLRMAPSHRLDPELYAQGSKDCRRAAVLFLLYPNQGELYTLLTVRLQTLPDHPGQVAFPGGARDERESVLQTALREAQEEVGVDPSQVEPLGRLTHLYVPSSRFCVQVVVGYTSQRPVWRPNQDEIAELLEVPLSLFFDPANWCEETVVVNGARRRIPYFRIGSHRVWGATAMALAEFVTAVEAVQQEQSST